MEEQRQLLGGLWTLMTLGAAGCRPAGSGLRAAVWTGSKTVSGLFWSDGLGWDRLTLIPNPHHSCFPSIHLADLSVLQISVQAALWLAPH